VIYSRRTSNVFARHELIAFVAKQVVQINATREKLFQEHLEIRTCCGFRPISASLPIEAPFFSHFNGAGIKGKSSQALGEEVIFDVKIRVLQSRIAGL
jgi:hypothetical protein